MRISEEQAIERLRHGDVVAIPTETVYGLAASIAHPEAIEAIFALKGRPRHNPLIVHLAKKDESEWHPMEALEEYIPQAFEGIEGHAPFDGLLFDGLPDLIAQFWPGPLTLVLPVRESSLSPIARADLPTAAFRMPLHPIAQRILSHTGPLVAPSANRSGSPSATCVEHVESDFGLLFPVVDGGTCQSGVESTILIAHKGHWRIGRLGAISPETLAEVLGYLPEWEEGEVKTVCCPGQLYRHYAPRAKLILGTSEPSSHHPVIIGFSDRPYHHLGAQRLLLLSSSNDPVGALNRLYHVLRALDQEQIAAAWVDLRIPETGLWRTLRERLIRAAAG